MGKTAIEAKLKDLRESKKVGFKKDGQKYVYWIATEDDFRDDLFSLPEENDLPVEKPTS